MDSPQVPEMSELPEFVDVRKDNDGTYRATHKLTGRPISATTWLGLVADAVAVRVAEDFKRACS